MAKKHLFTSESVSEGHPDKVADQISDAVLDACLRLHPMARVAIETLVTTNYVLVAGEVGGTGEVDLNPIVRDAVKRVVARIGYQGDDFSPETIRIDVRIHEQAREIGDIVVERDGAGDQGLMFGYACRETPEFMPAALQYAHAIVKELARLRHAGDTRLGPDAKSQVTLEYVDGKPVRAHTVVVSHQHREDVTTAQLVPFIRDVVTRVLPTGWIDDKTTLHVNPTGSFVQGGPAADTGLTGRKIIVDTYGGSAPHGGGAFSGKDPSKVDRSAAYAARWVAKNIVAAGLADRCTVQVAYAIGVAEPVSLYVDTHGTGRVDDARIEAAVRASCSLTPKSIRDRLGLRAAIYERTASYGHFGRAPEADGGFSWERLDLVEELKRHVGEGMPPEYANTSFDFCDTPVELPGSFAVIAGGYPRVEQLSADENRVRETELKMLLAKRGFTHRRLIGWGPKDQGGRHEEESWLVVCSRDEAVDLGRAFDQDAVWWVEGDALSVLPCLGTYPETPVTPGFRARMRHRADGGA